MPDHRLVAVALVGALVVFREQIGDVLNNIGDAFTS
jgi:Flp pilus assembly pilin Flp